MLQTIADLPAGVVAFEAHGRVRGEDYENLLVPVLERELAKRKKVRFLYHLGRDFAGFTARALWDDARVGLKHWRRFERVAVVTEAKWIAKAVVLFGFFLPATVRVFPEGELEAAKAWVAAELGPPVATPR